MSDTFSFTTRNAGDFINWAGDKAGDAIRLLTDKEVMEGLRAYGSAYATGGSSEGIMGMLQGLPPQGQDFFNKLIGGMGRNTKTQVAGFGGLGQIPPIYLLAGAGLILLVLILK